MATKPKKNARYDLNAADRRRNLLIQIGLTAIVVLFAVGLVLYIVTSGDKKPASGEAKSIRVTSSKVINKEGTSDPKAVVSLYEDFLCPPAATSSRSSARRSTSSSTAGPSPPTTTWSPSWTRRAPATTPRGPGAAAYCVADESKDAFRRFHAALYAQQPGETGASFPDNSQLIEVARQAGAGGRVPDCINKGKYVPMVQGLAAATGTQSTPDDQDQRRGLRGHRTDDARGPGRQGQGDRR